MKKLFIPVLILLLVACNAKKKTVSSKEDDEMQEEVNETTSDLLGDLNDDFDEPEEVDSLFASIERSPCFGMCPNYALKVYDNGYCTYLGKSNVDHIGSFEGWVDAETLLAIRERAEEIGYFTELGDEYDDRYVTDIPATVTTLDFGGQHKSIKNRYQGPEELSDFEDYMDELFANVDWKEVSAPEDR